MLQGPAFRIVAGLDLVEAMRAETARRIPHTGTGYQSESLCALQRERAGRGIVGAEIVESIYGYSVRYDSGVQNWGLLACTQRRGGTLDGTFEAAEQWARAWVAQDPARRYAWTRNKVPVTVQ